MIIVKQDKKGIVNFNNVTDIYIDKEDDGDRHFVFYIPVSNIDGLDILGIYETEERAKEVLAEIVQKYSSYLQLNGGPAILQGQMDIQPNIFNIPKVYEMPEK